MGRYGPRPQAHHDPHLVRESLTQTDEQRDVSLLRAGCIDGNARRRVLMTARHHACESLYGDPVYGGNRDARGWAAIGFDGDVQPRGWTDDEVTNPR